MTTDETWAPQGVDTNVPNVARIYDYFLGGKNHFAVDRAAAEGLVALEPDVPALARANRKFLGRAVRHLAEAGVRQFIDIGTGLPTMENVHQIAQGVIEEPRVVYADHDPVVCAQARALLARVDTVAVVHADLRDVDAVLDAPATARLIDPGEPYAVLLFSVLHFVPDDAAYAAVSRHRDAMPSGSYLALSQASYEVMDPELADAVQTGADLYTKANSSLNMRTPQEIARFFDGLDIVPPGLVPLDQWRPDGPPSLRGKIAGSIVAGVGMKP